MRIAVVTPWFPTVASPVEGIFHLRDVELLSRDHDVTVLHLDGTAGSLIVEDVTHFSDVPFSLIRVPYSLWKPLRVLRARRLLRSVLPDYDLVHTMSGPAVIPFFGMKMRSPWVHTEHWTAFTREPYTLRERLSLAIIRIVYARPEVVVAVSTFLGSNLKKIRKAPVQVIGNFVRKTDVKPPQNRSPGRFRIVGVGSLIERKGPQLAVEAISVCLENNLDVELLWIGDGPLLSDLEKLTNHYQLSDRITFVPFLPNEEVQERLAGADVFVAPTELETFGVAIAEAMMNGLPVVVTGIGGFTDFLEPLSSRVVTPRTGQAIAEGIRVVLTDPSVPSRAEIASSARLLFSEENRREKYRKIYDVALQLFTERLRSPQSSKSDAFKDGSSDPEPVQ